MTTMISFCVSKTNAKIILGALSTEIVDILSSNRYNDEVKITLVGEREVLLHNLQNEFQIQDVTED